ncbi:MAG: nickel-responsive transcriptional regulator NikR [Methanosarcinales archaeon]|nr:nickel-responsive transcriptional regulator NikR [Methanosarcinales archaeon]
MDVELSRIGVSLPENLLDKFDVIIKNRGYSSRSEGIRDAIRSYIRYYDWMKDIQGERVATITLAYNHKQRGIEDALGNVQHKYLDIIRTSIHMHLDNDYCMEVIILNGDGEKIRELSENLVRHKGILHVKLNTINPKEI